LAAFAKKNGGQLALLRRLLGLGRKPLTKKLPNPEKSLLAAAKTLTFQPEAFSLHFRTKHREIQLLGYGF
jgi:hypothetical protein